MARMLPNKRLSLLIVAAVLAVGALAAIWHGGGDWAAKPARYCPASYCWWQNHWAYLQHKAGP
ncbi:hypothetical protein RKE30_41055 [Streptomyces sp. Li-HN-5-11]|uniref:hypothetical protein n=1 Tax=Streptomyces sp. Li-HN-5-11 TaxID=3075432 RepID=UPI0028AB1C2B|nr:hypothetical protein [Streptomyces sp. Li-HN-5-11]WNM36279.1 hypothetical protein RKE30_41055 [Streptomyces sp. Li-HN-5-11]